MSERGELRVRGESGECGRGSKIEKVREKRVGSERREWG